jgi:hypothetical protein
MSPQEAIPRLRGTVRTAAWPPCFGVIAIVTHGRLDVSRMTIYDALLFEASIDLPREWRRGAPHEDLAERILPEARE